MIERVLCSEAWKWYCQAASTPITSRIVTTILRWSKRSQKGSRKFSELLFLIIWAYLGQKVCHLSYLLSWYNKSQYFCNNLPCYFRRRGEHCGRFPRHRHQRQPLLRSVLNNDGIHRTLCALHDHGYDSLEDEEQFISLRDYLRFFRGSQNYVLTRKHRNLWVKP